MTATIEKYRWLKWLSDPVKRENMAVKNSGDGDDAYALAAHPVRVFVNDRQWAFASNGAASLMINDYAGGRLANAKQTEMIKGLLDLEVHGKSFSMANLRHWAGTGWCAELPCKACGGDWAKNCPTCWGVGKSKNSCEHCGDTHECSCRVCDGDGLTFCPDCADGRGFSKKPGHINNAVIDRAMLARYLSGIQSTPGAQVKVMATGKVNPVVFEVDDQSWRIVIMPLRDHESTMGPALA